MQAIDVVSERLQYVCAAMVPSKSEIVSGIMPSVSDLTTVTAGQAFTLHSRPGASKVILLDFDGHTTANTNWNAAYGSITSPAYDVDGVPTSFSSTELSNIYAMWRAVAEDYVSARATVWGAAYRRLCRRSDSPAALLLAVAVEQLSLLAAVAAVSVAAICLA